MKYYYSFIFEHLKLFLVNIFKSQFFKNSAWTIADVVSYSFIMVIATPFFINHLGVEQYGLWMLINVVVQVMNALNFGLGDSTVKEVSKHHAMHVYEQLNKSFNRNFSLGIVLLFCCLLLGFITSKIIAYNGWFNIQQVDMPKAMLTLVLFSCSAGLKFIEQVFVSVFKGLQRLIVPYYFINGSKFVKINSLFEIVLRGTHVLTICFFYRYFRMESLLWSLIIVTIVSIPFQYFLFNKLILQEFNVKESIYPLLPALGIVLLVLSTSAWLNMVLLIYIVIMFKWIYYNKIKDIVKNFMLKGNA